MNLKKIILKISSLSIPLKFKKKIDNVAFLKLLFKNIQIQLVVNKITYYLAYNYPIID